VIYSSLPEPNTSSLLHITNMVTSEISKLEASERHDDYVYDETP